MDTLTRMRAFLDVVDAEGFSAAARKIGRSKALLSKYVRELEDELGALLINRTTRQFSLTEAGHTYFRRASEILRDIDALALPTTACVAPLLSEPTPREPLTRFTRPFNATGQPAISIPFGPSDLLAGLQIVGRRGDDDALLQLAAAVAARLAETGAPV